MAGMQTGIGAAPETGDELSLGAVGRALWHKKRSIIGPTLMMAAAAFIAVNLITPRFKSEARVLVESRENIFLRPEAEKAMIDRVAVDQETVTSQVQLVLSRDLARAVIAQLKLDELAEFNAALNDFSPMVVLRYIGLAKDPMSMTLEERVLAAYYDRLSAFAVDKSRVIVIEFQSADSDLAAKVANAIAEKYLVFQQVAKQDQARSAGKWLSGELENLRGKVSEAEAKVEAYRAKSNLFVGTNNTGLINQQLTELSSQVSTARAQKADAEARAHQIREALRTGQSLESSAVANSELIRRLSEQRVTLRAQLAEQSSTLLPQHPRIKEMRAQVADLDQQIRTEAERLARSLENEAKVAGSRLETLTSNLDQLKRQTASTSDQDVQLRALEREAKAQRDLFESYLAKYREATARDSIAAAPADARIISRAAASNVPYFPKKVPIVLIAALGMFSISTAFVVTNMLLGSAAYRPTFPSYEGVTLVPSAPLVRLPNARTRAGDQLPGADNRPPLSAMPVPARSVPVRTVDDVARVLHEAGDDGRCIAVIGGARNVGTTMTAIGLARLLAETNRVVLVDLAFNSPNIDMISDEPHAPGIADLVHGVSSFDNIITKDQYSRLHLVAAGQVGDDARGVIHSPVLAAAVSALAQNYDYLVIDAGSRSETSLAPIVALARYAVLVGGETPVPALQAQAEEMRSAGFADVMVLTGPPPALDHVVPQSSAA